MTSNEVKELREKLQAVLDTVGEKLKYKFLIGTIKYGEQAFCKLTICPVDPDTNRAETPEEVKYRQVAVEKNLPSDGIGRRVRSLTSGLEFVVTGYLTRAKRFDLAATRIKDNKPFKLMSTSIAWVEQYPEVVAFQKQLDADPTDHLTRLVLADWLEEHDDDRAEGYRALAKIKAILENSGNRWRVKLASVAWLNVAARYSNYPTREELENHLALSFRKLPDNTKKEILGY